MKPCPENRKLIAWLAADALDAHRARDLCSHLESCEGCRGYLEEISSLTKMLAAKAPAPELRASESFHHRLVDRLRAEKVRHFGATVAAMLGSVRVNWRVAFPLAGAAAIAVIAALSPLMPRPAVPLPAPASAVALSAPKPSGDRQPTLANYQAVASQSLEKLDELVTREGNRNLSPAPIYTASALLRAPASD